MQTRLDTKRILGLAAISLLVLPFAVSASPQGPQRGGIRGRPGGPQGPHHGFMMERLVRRLELSEDQRDSIRSILEARHAANEPLRGQLEEKRRAVFEASRAEPIDDNAIRAAVLDAAALEAELAVSRAQVRSEIWQQLTPEQQEKAKLMRETMREFREEFRGPGGESGRGRHGRGPSRHERD